MNNTATTRTNTTTTPAMAIYKAQEDVLEVSNFPRSYLEQCADEQEISKHVTMLLSTRDKRVVMGLKVTHITDAAGCMFNSRQPWTLESVLCELTRISGHDKVFGLSHEYCEKVNAFLNFYGGVQVGFETE